MEEAWAVWQWRRIAVAFLGILIGAAPELGQTAAVETIDLPSQPLSSALTSVGERYGITIVVPGELTAGKTAPAISGTMTPIEAVSQLLDPTTLNAELAEPDLIIVAQATAEERPADDPPGTPSIGSDTATTRAAMTSPAVDEIIITARMLGTQSYRADSSAIGTKTDTPLLETPVSASVVTRAFLDDTQVTTVTEALRYIPGISSGDNGRAAVDENITFRGFSFLRSTFVDGLRQQAFNIDVTPEPYGLERVEILRGPASVLYGSTGPGGIVNSITRRPRRDFSGEATVAAGSLGLLRAGFDVTGSLNEDKTIAGRLTAHVRDQDDFVDAAFNDRVYFAPALSFFPGSDTEITLLATYQRDEFRLAPLVPAEGTVLPSPNGKIDRETFLGEPNLPSDEVETFSGTFFFTHRFSENVSLQHASGIRDYERSGTFIFPELPPGEREVNRSLSAGPNNATVFSTDTSLSMKFSSGNVEHNLLVGADYYRIDDDSSTEGGTLPPLDAFTPEYTGEFSFSGDLSFDSSTRLDQVGFYVQDQIRFGDRLRVALGGRVDSFEVDFLDEVSGFTIFADDNA
ncbi:MAG: TonB-dependent receptor, partial [Pseudomonadota bacterium]